MAPAASGAPAPGHLHRTHPMTAPIAVLIVEREALYRRGLVGCLESHPAIRVVGSAATAAEGYRQADAHLPDVALVGTTLTDAPGLAAATELRRRSPTLATIVVAAVESDDELFAAIRAGAAAYVGKGVDGDLLLGLVRRAAAGEWVINEQWLGKPYVAARVLEQFRAATGSDPAPTSALTPLTEREMQVLEGVAAG